MDRPQEDFKTPLANSSLLEKATIPRNKGQYAEFRKFDHFDIETNGTDDSPMTYAENSEPSTPVALAGTVIQVPFTMLAAYTEIGNVQEATDPIDLVKKAKDEFFVMVRRMVHRLTNDRMVKSITDNIREDAGEVATAADLPSPFKAIYAGGVQQFEDLGSDSFITMSDFWRAVMLLRNANVPGVYGRMYAAIIDEGVAAQLMDDAEFKDAVKRHQDLNRQANVEGVLADYKGCRFILQDDSYRCALVDADGALTTRDNDGAVHVAHVLGKGAAGYVDFGGSATLARRTLRPTFKVTDTSKTGTGPSIGWRIPYQAACLDRRRGLNLAGTTAFGDSIDDIV